MKLIVGENSYNVKRVEQIIMSGTENLNIFSEDMTIDINILNEAIRGVDPNVIYIDDHEFTDFILNCIRKNMSDEGYDTISIEMYKNVG